jgi:hypothetical protein
MVHKCKQDLDLYKKGFSPVGSRLTNGQGRGHGNNKIGCNGSDEKFPTPRQKHNNLEHTKMLTLIFCKHAKHTTLKEFIDPWAQMISSTQHRNKIVEKLQQRTKNKFPRNGRMCKNKWNSLNSNYKKIYIYYMILNISQGN